MKKFIQTLVTMMAASFHQPLTACNIAEGRHDDGNLTLLADAALTTRHLRVKFGSDASHFALAGAEAALGICTDDPDSAESPYNVALHGAAKGTKLGVASGAIVAGAYVVGAASGKFQTLTGISAGTYYVEGRAVQTAADGDTFEVETCTPYPVTVS
jgi:hypothetical protein